MAENPLRLTCDDCGLTSTPPDNKPTLGYECPNCGGVNFESARDVPMCDFCCKPGEVVVASYPARSFSIDMGHPNVHANSRDWWASCQACYDLIEKQDREALAERSARSFVDQGDRSATSVPFDVLLSSIRDLQDQFWSNREGESIYHGEVPAWPKKLI